MSYPLKQSLKSRLREIVMHDGREEGANRDTPGAFLSGSDRDKRTVLVSQLSEIVEISGEGSFSTSV